MPLAAQGARPGRQVKREAVPRVLEAAEEEGEAPVQAVAPVRPAP